jgi:hypothetical protein
MSFLSEADKSIFDEVRKSSSSASDLIFSLMSFYLQPTITPIIE